MGKILFNENGHQCIVFDEILDKAAKNAEDIQTNQFLIINNDEGLLYDPGGAKVFQPLFSKLTDYIDPKNIEKIVISHQDPDTGAAVNYWSIFTSAEVYISSLWIRFIPHFSRMEAKKERFKEIPDSGLKLSLGTAEILLLPAHFIHSPGNIQLYDKKSKILLSGDLGVGFAHNTTFEEVKNFEVHTQYMEAFHKRYIPSNKALRLWADMASKLDIDMIVPQHGKCYFKGKEMVGKFINWARNYKCGLDLMEDFKTPE